MRYLLAVVICLKLLLLPHIAGAKEEVLPVGQVFVPRVSYVDDSLIRLTVHIEPGYYLYRQRLFKVEALGYDGSIADTASIVIDNIELSAGRYKTDAFLGTQSIWYGGEDVATITLNYQNPAAVSMARLRLKYQGCRDGVICYPPTTTQLVVSLPTASTAGGVSFSSARSSKLFSTSSQQQTLASSSPATTGKPDLFAKSDSQPLLPEQAFPLTVERTDAENLTISWQLPDGYYLYRDKIGISGARVASVELSEGEPHHDDFFGEQSIYRDNAAVAHVALQKASAASDDDAGQLSLQFQGCQEGVICYPMITRKIPVGELTVDSSTTYTSEADNVDALQNAQPENYFDAQSGNIIDRLTQVLQDSLWLGAGMLFIAGVALAFTPCVLPMLPILLGIITNQRQVGKMRAIMLASAYALGVAVMMAVVGLLVAKTGINLQIVFQNPLWLIIFAAIFVIMGMAMLGFFSIAMPVGVQSRVNGWQNKFQQTNFASLFIVGALSTLVVGPCVAPPLIAILTFIATTDDSLLGALYLFALGLGMSAPLVVFAAFAGLVPKTGAFSRLVTRIFAMLMFGVALWLLARLLPDALSMALWGAFMLVLAVIFWRTELLKTTAKQFSKVVATACLLLGTTWVAGGAMGNGNLLKPFSKQVHLPFVSVNNSAELEHIITTSDKPVMLDLYADWCVTCKELEYITFTDKRVVTALADFTLLKLDISKMTAEREKLLAELGLIAPPTLVFFIGGKELKPARQIGNLATTALLDKLTRLKNAAK